MLLASPAGRAELERWPQYQRGAIVTDASGRCHVKVCLLLLWMHVHASCCPPAAAHEFWRWQPWCITPLHRQPGRLFACTAATNLSACRPAPPVPQLGVFQFFLCWFAFYVIKGDGGGGVDALLSRPQSAGLTSSVRKVSCKHGWHILVHGFTSSCADCGGLICCGLLHCMRPVGLPWHAAMRLAGPCPALPAGRRRAAPDCAGAGERGNAAPIPGGPAPAAAGAAAPPLAGRAAAARGHARQG